MRKYKDIAEVRDKLKEKWSIGYRDYWSPLNGDIREDTEFFNYQIFQKEFGMEKLGRLISDLGHTNIYELNEANDDEKVGVIEMEDYSGRELYYTNEDCDWVVYLSHENTITIAGPSLLHALKIKWTDWNKYARRW
jgi:hypothetical protein